MYYSVMWLVMVCLVAIAMAAGGTVDDKNNYPGVKKWYRIVFAGDPGIGKTSLLLRFVKDEFHDPPPTILGEANRFLKVMVLEGVSGAWLCADCYKQ